MLVQAGVKALKEISKKAINETKKEIARNDMKKKIDSKIKDANKDKIKDGLDKVKVDLENPAEALKEKGTEIKDNVNKLENTIEKKTELKKAEKGYLKELNENSPCKETLKDFDGAGKLEKQSPERVKELRQEFNNNRNKLIKEWEELHGCEWPKYEKDVAGKDGKVVRHKGDYLEAHHIKPLSHGGLNEAKNITPLHYDVHNDHKGIHKADGNYSKMNRVLKELS